MFHETEDLGLRAGIVFTIKARSPFRTVLIEATAPTNSFASVSIPTSNGWKIGDGGQSFSATVRIRAYSHKLLKGLLGWMKKVADRVFQNACLEFGGSS
jgi:hypothetical protein